jgi:multisubunit Na+/H+ antiporter MnhF subunit
MSDVLSWVLWLSLGIHLLLAAVLLWRVWRGENLIDRLISADVIGTLLLCALVLMALLRSDAFFIDAGLGLAALGAIGTIALARFLANNKLK